MTKKIIFTIIFIMAISITPTFAFSYDPISITGTHIIKDNEELSSVNNIFVLTAKNDAPMPEGSENGIKKVVVPSNTPFDFGPITVPKPGTYEYKVSREITPSERLAQDDSVYDVRVAVFSDSSRVTIYQKENESAKADKIEYTDSYLFSLTFNLNGGTYNNSSEDIVLYYPKGTEINLPGKPEKEGYVFDYWKGSRYAAGAKYKVTSDHTFNAIYKSGTSDNNNKNKKESTSNESSSNINSQTGDELKLFVIGIIFILILLMYISIKRRKKNG